MLCSKTNAVELLKPPYFLQLHLENYCFSVLLERSPSRLAGLFSVTTCPIRIKTLPQPEWVSSCDHTDLALLVVQGLLALNPGLARLRLAQLPAGAHPMVVPGIRDGPTEIDRNQVNTRRSRSCGWPKQRPRHVATGRQSALS